MELLSINSPTAIKRKSVLTLHRLSKGGIPGGGCLVTVGDRVAVGPSHMLGYVRFVGGTHFSEGEWVGVELDGPYGKNNGSVQGQHYFDCETNHGLFCRSIHVAKCDILSAPNSPRENKPSATSSPRTVMEAEAEASPVVYSEVQQSIQNEIDGSFTEATLEGNASLLQLGEQLERRLWEGLERRLEEMIQKAVASATHELWAELQNLRHGFAEAKLQPSKESNRDEHCVVECALHNAGVIKCALHNAEIKLQPSKETDTDDNNSAMHCIIRSASYNTSTSEICATTDCTFDNGDLVPLAQQRRPPPIDTSYAGIATQGEQETMGIPQIIKHYAGLNIQQTPATDIPAQNTLELAEENMRESRTLSEIQDAEDNGQLRRTIRTISTE